jgi:hypothetical protein
VNFFTARISCAVLKCADTAAGILLTFVLWNICCFNSGGGAAGISSTFVSRKKSGSSTGGGPGAPPVFHPLSFDEKKVAQIPAAPQVFCLT